MKIRFDLELIKKLIIMYFPLTLLEHYLTLGSFGSAVKLFGFLIIAVFLLYKIKYREGIKLHKTVFPVMIWVIFMTVSLVFSPGKSVGFDYLQAILYSFVLLIVVQDCPWKKVDYVWLCNIFSIVSVLMSIAIMRSGVSVARGFEYRLTLEIFGKSFDPNNLAALLSVGIFMSLHLMMEFDKRIVFRIIHLAMGLVIFLGCFMTGSRGAFVGIIVGVALYILFYGGNRKRRAVKIVVFLLAIPLAFLVYRFIFSVLDANLLDRMNIGNILESEGANRLEIWGYNIKTYIIPNLFFGLGIGGYSFYREVGSHNTYLLVLMDVGVFGLASFVWAFVRYIRKIAQNRCIAGLMILACMAIEIFFIDSYHNRIMWNGFMIVEILISIYTSDTSDNALISKNKSLKA